MKKFLAIIMLCFSPIMFVAYLIVTTQSPSESSGVGPTILASILFLIPGALLIVYGIKMLRGSNETANTNRAQARSEQSNSSKSNEVIYTLDFGDQGSIVKGTAVSNEPVSVDCSGCGSKTTVNPNQLSECEYCGTIVKYKEK